MKQRLLITGFEPFGRETINPSWEAVKRLEDAIGDWKLKKLQVPTVFGAAAEVVLQAAEAYAPDVILSVGQAGGRCAVTPEWVALNLREASMADNVGYMPQEEPVVTGGPAAYFSTLPCRRMVEAVKACDIPCALSYTAGTYVCNDLFYTTMREVPPGWDSFMCLICPGRRVAVLPACPFLSLCRPFGPQWGHCRIHAGYNSKISTNFS